MGDNEAMEFKKELKLLLKKYIATIEPDGGGDTSGLDDWKWKVNWLSF